MSCLREQVESTDGLDLVAWKALSFAPVKKSLEIPCLCLDVAAHVDNACRQERHHLVQELFRASLSWRVNDKGSLD